ncbi:hypothetical protein KP509_21G012700 [Ceratopteris richardii]|uniref:NYN domain-containing protein n=1 Tax=Ceratopteris richardii TaxID=49495 RepID=A0A8T2S7U0_CERRI|nr:hypothetical protein KP509_21G012700 [Ceratopteris richardii]
MGEDTENKSKISIWWDIENCHVPKDVDPHFVAQNITGALHHASLTGPIEIQAFGDTKILPHATQKALTDTGITLNHVPRGNKDAADKAILVGMLLWALDNPAPANILLVSGDGDFANALHRLRLKTYNILLATPAAQFVKPALTGAAKKRWFWKDMAQGILAGPDSKQLTSSASSKDHAGLNSHDPTLTREMSSSLMTSVSQSSLVSNGYASPQKITSTLEHFRSLNLMHHSESVFSQNRSHPCGQEMVQTHSQDSKVPAGTVFNGSCSSNPTSGQCLQSVLDAKHTDLVQEPSVMPECIKRVDSSGDPFPRGPLRHITPNTNNISTDNTSLVRNSNYKLPHKHDIAEHQVMKTISPHRTMPVFLLSSGTLENKLEKLSYASCLDKIYSAMKTLQRDMLAPSENNLSECIEYWDPQAIKVNVKETLETAAASRQVTKAQLGGGLIMYLPPDQCIPWDCVDPGNMSLIYRVDAWIELQRFLLYDEKKQVFLSSCSRYISAMILKTSCGPHIQSERPRATDLGQHTNQGSPQPNTWISDLLPVAEKTSDRNTARAKIIF